MDEIQKINVRFPEILYKRMQARVKERQGLDPGYSANSYVVGLVREDLDGPVEIPYEPFAPKATYAVARPNPSPGMSTGGKPTAADLAAKFGIKTGATIEVVEPRMDAESGFIPGAQVSTEGQQPVPGASEKQTSAEIIETGKRNLFIEEFGREALLRGMRIGKFVKATWDQRFEMAREQKERGE